MAGAYLLFLDFGTWAVDDGNNFSLAGPRVGIVLPGRVDALRWYRSQAGAVHPTHLTLYRQNDLSGVVSVFNPTDDGNVGWQVTELDPPISVESGDVLFCGGYFPIGCKIGKHGVALPTPVPDTQWVSPWRAWAAPPTDTYPAGGGSSNDFFYAFDFRYLSDRQDLVAPGIDTGDLHAELNAWLTPTGDYYTDSALQAIQTAATSADTSAGNAATAAAGAQTAAEGNASAISNVSTELDGVSGNVGTLLNRLSADLATKLNEASDQLAAWLNGAAAAPGQLWTDFLSHFTAATGGSGFGSPDPLQGWTLQDTLEITDEAAWAQEADLYRLNLDSTGSLAPADPVAGVPVTYRLGWWSVLDGSFFRQRAYIDGPNADLIGPSGRMPGLVVFLNHGGHGTIEAWTKD